MKYIRVVLVLLALSCTAGCYVYPARAVAGINVAWQGKHVDEFFLEHGPPGGVYELDDGRVIYTWSAGQRTVHIPSTTTTTGHLDSYGGFQSTSQTSGGFSVSLRCTLNIHTDPAHLVKEIELKDDTIGLWKLSRFEELFGEYKAYAPQPTSATAKSFSSVALQHSASE